MAWKQLAISDLVPKRYLLLALIGSSKSCAFGLQQCFGFRSPEGNNVWFQKVILFNGLYKQGSTAGTEWKPFVHTSLSSGHGQGCAEDSGRERGCCIIRDWLPASGWVEYIVIMMQFGRTAGVISFASCHLSYLYFIANCKLNNYEYIKCVHLKFPKSWMIFL